MQRFFLEVSLWETQMILQDDEIMYQLVKVLRSQAGDEVIFYNGEENIDFVYKITSIDKKNIIFSMVEKIEKPAEKWHLGISIMPTHQQYQHMHSNQCINQICQREFTVTHYHYWQRNQHRKHFKEPGEIIMRPYCWP